MKVQPKDYEVVVGELFKAAYRFGRTARGEKWTYRKLEAASGVSKSRIGDLVSGRARKVNLDTAEALADALGKDPEDIFLLRPLKSSETEQQVA